MIVGIISVKMECYQNNLNKMQRNLNLFILFWTICFLWIKIAILCDDSIIMQSNFNEIYQWISKIISKCRHFPLKVLKFSILLSFVVFHVSQLNWDGPEIETKQIDDNMDSFAFDFCYFFCCCCCCLVIFNFSRSQRKI